MITRKTRMAALILAIGLSGTAQAALYDRGGGLIYDDVLNVTWLQDANYAMTSGYHANGLMTWDAAVAWVDQLVYGGFDDWRLPTVNPIGATFNYDFSNNGSTDIGYGNSSPNSEMAYMYYANLNNLGYCTPNGGGSTLSCNEQGGWGLNHTWPFLNIQPDTYWLGTEYEPDTSGSNAWDFGMGVGGQYASTKLNQRFAWAVRDGDVAAVPEPETYAMMLAGLGLVGFLARSRKH